ncbi:MAG: PIN domain-containing protein [Cyanobacteria bacterium WB6_1B_304]|nr:PIN domain-containing protein [Cyanobacteria bacterium WB6_1B_304]
MKRVLFDSDVLLDVLLERQPFVTQSAKALNWATLPGNEGMVAAHAITNMFYILRRKVNREAAMRLLLTIAILLTVASITQAVIDSALRSSMTDFEDAVTSAAASFSEAGVLITRNGSDFKNSLIPALSPREVLDTLSNSEPEIKL